MPSPEEVTSREQEFITTMAARRQAVLRSMQQNTATNAMQKLAKKTGKLWLKRWSWSTILPLLPMIGIFLAVLFVVMLLVALADQCTSKIRDAVSCLSEYGLLPLRALFDVMVSFFV